MQIANSLLAAAAVVRLNRRGQFPVRDFMRTVREIEGQMRGPANGL